MAIVTNQPQVIRVTVPGPQGPSAGAAAAATISLNDISNVDVTTVGLQNGAILLYNSTTQKWTARNELDTTADITLNSGSF